MPHQWLGHGAVACGYHLPDQQAAVPVCADIDQIAYRPGADFGQDRDIGHQREAVLAESMRIQSRELGCQLVLM